MYPVFERHQLAPSSTTATYQNLRVHFMKRRSILASTLLFALSLSVTVGCSNPGTETKAARVPGADAVKIGYSAWIGFIPWQVAQAKDLFTANKVDVDLQWFPDYTKSLGLLQTGKLDANNQPLTDVVIAVAGGADLVVVMTNDNSTGADQIIVSNKIKSIKDLKGKKVAVEEGGPNHFLLAQVLKKAGMTFKDIQLVKLETSKAAAAFAAGQVDAVSAFAPFTTTALKRAGSRELFSSGKFPGLISDHLVFTRKFVNAHPEKVQAVVDSWFKTLDYINTSKNKDEANELIAKKLGISVTEYKDAVDGAKLFGVEDNLEAFGTGNDNTYLANTAVDVGKFLLENGIIKTKVDTSKLFDDRFVKAYAAKKQAR
jgi:NitT/TauT family transport system substrate-binding protein